MATTKTTTTKTVSKPKAEKVAKKTTVSLDAVIYSQTGKKSGTIALPAKVFGTPWNGDLVHQVVVSMMANARAGTAHTKDRSEVSGGGKKPWKQKGTGRARHGSTRSPIWIGGGVTHGPRNDKDYSQKINKKSRVKALFVVLSRKYADGAILFVDSVSLSAIKTKDAAGLLTGWATIDGFNTLDSKKPTNALMVVPESDTTVEKSFANLPGITLARVPDLNPALVMKYRTIIMVAPATLIPVLEAKMK